MEKFYFVLLALLTQIATSTVQDMDQVHALALEGNLTRFVHLKMTQSHEQAAALAGVFSILNDDAGLDPGNHRRRLTSVDQPRRIFRPAGIFEERHVAYGLDRWFKIAVASNDDDAVAAGLAVEEALTRIENDETSRITIEYAEAAPTIALHYRSNDMFRDSQSHYDAIHLDAAHDITAGSSDVTVAVVDSGLYLSHRDFQQNVWKNDGEICDNGVDDDNNGYVDDCFGYNFADDLGGRDILGDGDHGTHVSGTIAADTDNRVGVAGVAGGKQGAGGVKIMTATVFGASGNRDGFDEAIVYGADNGARVSSNSWGYTSYGVYSQSILDAIDYATEVGCIVVFSAGNENSEHAIYPGHYYKTVNVAAVDNHHRRASFSNYGFSIDISAPGVSIFSTSFNSAWGVYRYKSGTSMACPHVSGVLALGFSINPDLSKDAAIACLYSTANNVDSINPGFENYLGAGMVDAYAFVQCAVAATLPPTSTPFLYPPLVSCDFEDAYLCGWTTGNADGKAWSRTTGETPTSGTGPEDYDSYFMFVESSYEFYASPYFLTSPTFDSDGAPLGLSYDLHMYGNTMGALEIQYLDGKSWKRLERYSGNQGNQWIHVKDSMIPPSANRIRFFVRTGRSDLSDICIDNVVVASLPTRGPSVSPAPAPTVTVKDSECAIVVDGNPSKDSVTACVGSADFGLDDSLSAYKTSRIAGTFCCDGDVAICDFDCEAVDFETAEFTCLSQGYRLCTESELLGGAATGSGCDLDYMHVWSSTPALCPDAFNITKIIAECIAENFPDDACQSDKSCAAVVDGNPSRDSMTQCKDTPDMHLNDYFVKSAGSTAGVMCCGDSGEDAISVCNDHCEVVGFDEATNRCDGIGMRLCTAGEVLNGVGKWTGCAYDFTHVWVGERMECPDCASIVDGHPKSDSSSCDLSPDEGLEDSLIARMDSVAAGVRCCSEDGSRAQSFCDYACQRVDYGTALSRCEEANMRLCTSAEMLGGISIGTGCNYDKMHVWTAETMMCSQSDLSVGTTAVCAVDGSPKNDNQFRCGGDDWNAADFKLLDPEVDFAGVRCCSDDGSATSLCPDGPCKLTDYQIAQDRCANVNMRLCTAQELLNEEAAGTGCSYDNTYVWSSTEGSCSANPTIPGDPVDRAKQIQECIEASEAIVKCNT